MMHVTNTCNVPLVDRNRYPSRRLFLFVKESPQGICSLPGTHVRRVDGLGRSPLVDAGKASFS